MEKKGCLIVFVVMMVLGMIIQGVEKLQQELAERKARREEASQRMIREREAQEQIEKKKKEDAERENELRLFALRESPELWNKIEELNTQIDNRHKRTAELSGTLIKMGVNLDSDEDYIAAMKEEENLRKRLAEVRKTLIDAYVASAKFKAATSTRESREIKNTEKSGINEADSIRKRYDQMKADK